MIENNTNLKEHIIEFNKFGLVVFPCIDKKPKIKFKDIEKQLVDEIFELFNDDDELAIRTGKGIVVVDIDTKGNDGQEGFKSLKKLETEYGKLPETLETKTRSGGVHKFFRINEEDELSNRTNLNGLIGVDIRATNGYVIAPPTKNYEFINIKPMAMLPAKWFHLIKREHKPENNVINLYDKNSEGKIVDNRDDKATKIIFSNLIDLALDKYKNKTNFDVNKLFEQSWSDFVFACDTKDPNKTLEQEGRGQKWLKSKCHYTFQRYLNDEFTDIISDAIQELKTFEVEDQQTSYLKVSKLLSEKYEPIEWIIDGWLLKNTICGLYAQAGTGKSAVAQALATCLSLGQDFGSKLKIKRPYKTLYVACEDPKNIYQARQKDINMSLNVMDDSLLENYLFMDRVGCENFLVNFSEGSEPKFTKFFHYLMKVIKDEKVEFLVLDVLQDFFGGNEIVRSDVNFFLKSVLGKMVKELGITILVIAHPSLAGQTGHKFSGSTSWRGGFRQMWYLEKLDDEGGNVLVMNKFKSNYSKSGDEENCYFKFESGCFHAYEKDNQEQADLYHFAPKIRDLIISQNTSRVALKKQGKLYLNILHSFMPEVSKQMIEKCIHYLEDKGQITYIDKKGWTAV